MEVLVVFHVDFENLFAHWQMSNIIQHWKSNNKGKPYRITIIKTIIKKRNIPKFISSYSVNRTM